MGPEPIGVWGLVGAAALVLLNGALSVWLRLGLERRVAIAALRTVVQLLLLGYVLTPVFRWESLALVLLIVALMVMLAAREATQRVQLRYRRIGWDAFMALSVAALVTTFVGTRILIGVEPWWQPRYFIPLVGMVLGNSLTGITLGLDRCLNELREGRERVEALLAFGATRMEAARAVIVDAMRTGMIPILNSMSVVGVVTIPGMMTGQIIAGASPATAAQYQIVIMFMVAAATALGAGCTVLLAVRRLFDEQHRLRLRRLYRTPAR